MHILHVEASPGWGGQELRILSEAIGMRERGHEVILAIQTNGGLVEPARAAGFTVYELPFSKSKAFFTLSQLLRLIRKHRIDVINTHSSLDAWLGGIAARLMRIKVVRTRHLSTPIRKGWNSRLLYNTFADTVVTTCQAVVPIITQQASLPITRCRSIPTGVNPKAIVASPQEVEAFRSKWGIKSSDTVIGTLCVLRGWKGVSDLLHAAKLLQGTPSLKWLIVGGGVSEDHFHREWRALGLDQEVIFTGSIHPPYVALAAMDIFLLLSWANEGVSQASLQAAYLKKPLITTTIGGLPEVCIHEHTGLCVAPHAPDQVATAVRTLLENPSLCHEMGKNAHALVKEKFTLDHTLDAMEEVYAK